MLFNKDISFLPILPVVWENGQIMMQGQSNKPKKTPFSNNFNMLAPKPHEGDNRNSNSSKSAKLDMVDSALIDFQLPVPSPGMSADNDDDMVPWLSYAMEDNLHHEYSSDFLRELSGVSIDDISVENPLASREKRNGFHGNNRHSGSMENAINLKHGNSCKTFSCTVKHRGGGSSNSDVPQILPHFQHNKPMSGSSDVTGNNNVNSRQITSQDSIHNRSSLCDFTRLRLQKLDAKQAAISPAFTNFPHIPRHPRADRLADKSSNRPENNEKRYAMSNNDCADSLPDNPITASPQKEKRTHNYQPILTPDNKRLESFPKSPTEKVVSPDQVKCAEDVAKNNALHNTPHFVTAEKTGNSGEKNAEPVEATLSVCSVNFVERAPNEPVRDLKRKSIDTGESEDPSEEVEEDSLGARKAPPNRSGLKRTRAAEVHNLSERRRRDRINEKMRALQELIPNCNKVDKASMLDEAIEYLKTLQFQVQIMSMSTGLCMQPMMLHPGIQAIQGAHMPPFSPLGVGMGMGMGFCFNMLNMNNSMKMIPFQGFHGMPSSSVQAFGHPGQGLPMPTQQPPVLQPSLNIPVGLNISDIAASSNAAAFAPSFCPKGVDQQMLHSSNVEGSMNHASNQLNAEGIRDPPLFHDQAQTLIANASENAIPQSEALHR